MNNLEEVMVMTQNSDSSKDFQGLDDLKLHPRIIEKIKQARVEARDIIYRLEPQHISGWPNLIEILERSLQEARINAEIFQAS